MNIRHGEIRLGDRIFARLVMGSRTVVEIMLDTVSGMTDVLGEVRKRCKTASGLARLYVRNHSRGWAEERPLMIYSANGSRGASPFGLHNLNIRTV